MSKINRSVNCKRCGKQFVANNGRQMFCSVECRIEYHEPGRWRKSKGHKTCKGCGIEFVPKKANQQYCTMECQKKSQKAREIEKNLQKKAPVVKIRRTKTMSPLAAAEAEAREKGMHYGQWRAAKDFGMRI